ncbi:MAG: phage holin family protein [Anaerolineae bacterium]
MRWYLTLGWRFLAVWVIDALSLYIMALFSPGIEITGPTPLLIMALALATAAWLGIINVLIRPLLLLLTLPMGMLTLGLTTLLINAVTLWLTAWQMPGFTIDRFWPTAIIGALVLSAVNTFITSLTTVDDDHSFYESIVNRLSKRGAVRGQTLRGRGLVILEIDGLSYGRMQRAIEQGLVPTVRQMIEEGSHVLAKWDCGLPSQTSSCQAGIMYGDNFDIPAFRWYLKDQGRMVVSNRPGDAEAINARYARGHGLLRHGSSINNLIAGDAKYSLFTLSMLGQADAIRQKRRVEDFYLFWLNPYVFARSLVLTLWDILVEMGQTIRQWLRDEHPRINRWHGAYPLLRAITNVLMRDVATFLVIQDVIRGVPAIYATYVGYDEVAHHAGPDTADAMNTLRHLDDQIRRIQRVIQREAPRPYDLFILSDHGQSVGATFRQRYGQTLKELIEGLVSGSASVAEVEADNASRGYTSALLAEMKEAENRTLGGRIGRETLRQGRKALERRVERKGAQPPAEMDSDVIVCCSGNLANVYFNLGQGKTTLDELEAAHPGLVEALVRHEGIGFVVGHVDGRGPVALGKAGLRVLRTGEVEGQDPLLPYGDPDLRARQVLRVAEFPHSGDLMVNSTLYPDGQVAAFEELVGSHGGLGGPQTEPFLLYPADMKVRGQAITNATDLYPLLNARRDATL